MFLREIMTDGTLIEIHLVVNKDGHLDVTTSGDPDALKALGISSKEFTILSDTLSFYFANLWEHKKLFVVHKEH